MKPRHLSSILPLTCLLALAGSGLPASAEDDSCLTCHAASARALLPKLQVDDEKWSASVHGAAGLSCDNCHAGKQEIPHQPSDPWKSCAECHADAVEQLAGSVHGKARQGDSAFRINCASCHGPVHALAPSHDAKSPVAPRRVAQTCGKCHADPKMLARTGLKIAQPLGAYTASVHARAVKEGKEAATCSACHGSHAILPPADPNSQVNRRRVPETCGKCHVGIFKVYAQSVHGRAAAQGIRESPVCIDCHGEHRILGPEEAGSPVFASNVPKMTCERCHGDLRMSEKFDLPPNVVSSFQDSFHGLASRAGSLRVANCASCHGVHNIRPSSDPLSKINKANLPKTCGTCHPGAGASFAIGPVHVLPNRQQHAAVYWVRLLYLWLIWGVIGGMVLHNLLDLRRKMKTPLVRPVVPVAERPVRMNRGFRIAHLVLMVSFIVLAYTGFALKWPEAWWSSPVISWEERLGLRGLIHRVAAVTMLAAFAFHFVHIAVKRQARACILAMLPNKGDLKELGERFQWFFGKRQELPHSPAVGYAEKAEYLALVWGTLVMAVTGFLLWFENFTLSWFPKWVADLSTVIHFYEAILATLAILVWHFYFVIFDPLVYPMDTAWLDGREAPGRMLERTESTVEPKPAKPGRRPTGEPGELEPAKS
jgi:cytochrome b subunit of formate dehydrogenase